MGVGDTYLVEYIAIVFLSLYVYMTAILAELTQAVVQDLLIRPNVESLRLLLLLLLFDADAAARCTTATVDIDDRICINTWQHLST